MNRRHLLKSLGLSAGIAASGSVVSPLCTWAQTRTTPSLPVQNTRGPFTVPSLPYSYDALEPYIDSATMHLHHDKHHASYVEKLNAAVVDHPELGDKNVDDLVSNLAAIPEPLQTVIRNQGGGHANHSFWWKILSKQSGGAPKAELAKDIDRQFGSLGQFQDQFSKAAGNVFGSGWAWLTLSHAGKLQIETSGNQDSPLTRGRTPILGIDVWEHAYYLKYQNRRSEYASAFFHIVNWDYVSANYASRKAACNPDLPCKVPSPLG